MVYPKKIPIIFLGNFNFITYTYQQSYNKLKYVKGGRIVDYTCC